jgi:hypothetical protein
VVTVPKYDVVVVGCWVLFIVDVTEMVPKRKYCLWVRIKEEIDVKNIPGATSSEPKRRRRRLLGLFSSPYSLVHPASASSSCHRVGCNVVILSSFYSSSSDDIVTVGCPCQYVQVVY